MKNARPSLSARCRAALRLHLRAKVPGNGDCAPGLGRAALTAGWLNRELAVRHERAVVALASVVDSSHPRAGAAERAENLFETEGKST